MVEDLAYGSYIETLDPYIFRIFYDIHLKNGIIAHAWAYINRKTGDIVRLPDTVNTFHTCRFIPQRYCIEFDNIALNIVYTNDINRVYNPFITCFIKDNRSPILCDELLTLIDLLNALGIDKKHIGITGSRLIYWFNKDKGIKYATIGDIDLVINTNINYSFLRDFWLIAKKYGISKYSEKEDNLLCLVIRRKHLLPSYTINDALEEANTLIGLINGIHFNITPITTLLYRRIKYIEIKYLGDVDVIAKIIDTPLGISCPMRYVIVIKELLNNNKILKIGEKLLVETNIYSFIFKWPKALYRIKAPLVFLSSPFHDEILNEYNLPNKVILLNTWFAINNFIFRSIK